MADKYGFKPMIWSDMFCKLAVSSSDYYSTADLEAIRKKANLPENLTLVYWDYYSTDYNRYSNMIEKNKAFGDRSRLRAAHGHGKASHRTINSALIPPCPPLKPAVTAA